MAVPHSLGPVPSRPVFGGCEFGRSFCSLSGAAPDIIKTGCIAQLNTAGLAKSSTPYRRW